MKTRPINAKFGGGGDDCYKLILLQEYLLHVIRLLESPINVIRAKAFLALQQIILSSHEMLLHACTNRFEFSSFL